MWVVLKRFTGRRIQREPLSRCDLVLGGSVLEGVHQRIGANRPAVWGAGFPFGGEAGHIPGVRYLAVRGELSRRRLELPDGTETVLGDPGLLAADLLAVKHRPLDRVGLIPHHVDQGAKEVRLLGSLPSVVTIDVRDNPIDVLDLMSRCRFIISSSLHGLIVADSLGIPNCWIEPSDKVIGQGWKFKDYYSALQVPPPRADAGKLLADLRGEASRFSECYERKRRDELKAGLVAVLSEVDR